MWRSDFQCFKDFDPIGMQGQTHGLSLWAPLHTGCCDRPDLYAFRSAFGTGIVFAFRRPRSPLSEMRACLKGLDQATPYEVIEQDTRQKFTMSGGELGSLGIVIRIDKSPGTRLFSYRRVSGT